LKEWLHRKHSLEIKRVVVVKDHFWLENKNCRIKFVVRNMAPDSEVERTATDIFQQFTL
jgi:hypothetical protein